MEKKKIKVNKLEKKEILYKKRKHKKTLKYEKDTISTDDYRYK